VQRAVTAILSRDPLAKRRQGKGGRPCLRHCCLFHQDPTPSADLYYDDDPFYYCFGCSEKFALAEVFEQLGLSALENAEAQHQAGPPHAPSTLALEPTEHYHNTLGYPIAIYPYRFPDGRLSHWNCRFEPKTFRVQAADGKWRLPEPYWPIYGDTTLPPTLNIIICEGEKAVGALNRATQLYQEALVAAITLGSANNFENSDARRTLIRRLRDLNPRRILIWGDNDKPGYEWSLTLYRQLSADAWPVKLVDVRSLALDKSQGPDDFYARGGSLEAVFIREFQQAGGQTLDSLIQQTVVSRDGFQLLASRKLVAFNNNELELHYYRATGDSTPSPKLIKRLGIELRNKAQDHPAQIAWRRWHDRDHSEFYWRPNALGYAYRVSAEGIRVAQDPPHVVVMISEDEETLLSPDVDESGIREDLEKLCAKFGQDHTAVNYIEAWLLTILLGLETPILLLRGEAGSGKTTFARALISIIEPTVPTIQMPAQAQKQSSSTADRALKLGLVQSIVALLDNVSSLSYDSEDLLCQLVTGYSTMHSPLYEERVVSLKMRRGVIITTNNWAPVKGDLQNRSIVLRTRTPREFIDDSELFASLEPIVEKVRGYLFKTAIYCYRRFPETPITTGFRLAGMGRIFAALGYDMENLDRSLKRARSELASESDTWYDVMLDLYHHVFNDEFNEGKVVDVRWEDFKAAIQTRTGYQPTNNELSRFVNDSLPRFRDYGFTIERSRSGSNRFWRIVCHDIPFGDD